MIITLDVVISILKKMKIDFDFVLNHNTTEYVMASVFSPINNGFYYVSDINSFELNVKNALIITNISQKALDPNNNYICLKSKHPQKVFYQILDSLHARVSNGIIAPNAIINKSCIIGTNVQIDDFCVIEENCVIGNNCIIGSHTKIHKNTSIGANTIIESSSIIGTQGVAWAWNDDHTGKIIQPQLGGVVVSENCFLGANTIIVRGSLNENTSIGAHSLLAPGCRIGHGTKIGSYTHLANSISTGGNTIIGDACFIGSGAIFRPKTMIHNNTIVGTGALVIKSTSKPGLTLYGSPAKEYNTKENSQGIPH